MADAKFQAELSETRNEVQRLKEHMSLGAPTVHKDLSLISLVPKWSGQDSTVTLEEIFESIEASARIERREQIDQIQIAALRLTFLFSLGQYDPKRNLTQHNFFIPKC